MVDYLWLMINIHVNPIHVKKEYSLSSAFYKREVNSENWPEPLSLYHLDFKRNRYSYNRNEVSLNSFATFSKPTTSTISNDNNTANVSFAVDTLARNFSQGFIPGTDSNLNFFTNTNIANAGTIMINVFLPVETTNRSLFFMNYSNISSGPARLLVRSTTNKIQIIRGTPTIFETTTNQYSGRVNFIYSWNTAANSYNIYLNGSKVYSNTNLATTANSKFHSIGTFNGTAAYGNNGIENYVVYNRQLTDNVCSKLASQYSNRYYSR